MKLPLSWLKELIDLEASAEKIDELLTKAGLEVDGRYLSQPGFDGVIVAQVTASQKHPGADSLSVATVTDGKESHQVVCGAPNCRKGLKTAFAKPGAILLDSDGKAIRIKRAKLRGIESCGMLLSEKEVGLGDGDDGIIELPSSFTVGQDLRELFSDTIFEISLTPNLGHAASVLGVARELKAQTGREIKLPDFSLREIKEEAQVPVTIKDFKKCPRYCCRVIKNVKIAESPLWLRQRLSAAGFRPVNNVVDATNYVLHEMGHPLHAFDLDSLSGPEIIVRKAHPRETFVALDNKRRELTADDLLITDSEKAVAIAGVIGGLNSEVKDTTKNILLEAACFDALSVRKTARRLNAQTESARRFERGVDPNNIINCLDRAAKLIQEVAGGDILKGVIDIKKNNFAKKAIRCRLSGINRILDTGLTLDELKRMLGLLEMECREESDDLLIVYPPTYRHDITCETDLAEEAARIIGFDNIPKRRPRFIASEIDHEPLFLFENEIRNRLIAEGLQEFLTCGLIGPGLIAKVSKPLSSGGEAISILNPTSVDQSILRPSFLPGLLNVVKYNVDRQIYDIAGFEIGFTYFKEGEKYRETPKAAIILHGAANPRHFSRETPNFDFFDLKGILENLLESIGIEDYKTLKTDRPFLHPRRQAEIVIDEVEAMFFGEVHPAVLRSFAIPERVCFAEIGIPVLMNKRKLRGKMRELPIYPSSSRDLTVTVDIGLPVQGIFDAIDSCDSKLLEKAFLVDVYQSASIGDDRKNLTIRFIYRHPHKTIEQETVEREHGKIVSQIESCIYRR